MDNVIASLMAKVLSGEADAEDIALVQAYIKDHPEEARQFELLKKIWPLSYEIKKENSEFEDREDNERLRRIMSRAAEERENEKGNAEVHNRRTFSVTKISGSLLRYAAVLVIVIAATLFIIKNNKSVRTEIKSVDNEVAAENGTRKRVLLPDGSTVLLNSGSKIKYAANFDGKTRDVTLFGEAFFDVVKQPDHPFIVHASNINIKVLGTAFNVKSYPEEDNIETTLIRGLIEINRQDNKQVKPIYLHPNEKITMPRCGDCLPVSKGANNVVSGKNQIGSIVNLDSSVKIKELMETAWIYNRLEFRKNSFREIAIKFERWYNVKIFISDDALASIKFNGSLENETLEEALKALQKTTPFKFKIINNEVFINVSD